METYSPANEIDSCKYLFLAAILEPEANSLRLLIDEGIVSSQEETLQIGGVSLPGARSIDVTPASRRFDVYWPSYISYSIRNESFCSEDKDEEWTGSHFRVYSRSKFLDFVSSGTFATSDYPGPYQHYELICSDHIIDVASQDPPIVRVVSA